MILSLLLTLPLIQEQASPRFDQIPTLSVADLVLQPYRPRNVAASDLAAGVQATLGRRFFVTERGGSAGGIVTNTTLVGGVLLVFDEPEYAKSVLDLCAEIDLAPPEAPVEYGTLSYRTRYISLERAEDTLRTMRRRVELSFDEQGGRVIAKGTRDELDALEKLLVEADVPDPRVMVTCYLLQGVLGGESAPSALLPEDLARDLGELLPQFSFGAAGFAMLQSSIAPGRSLRLVVATELASDYLLQFEVGAYDAESGQLTAERCQLMEQTIEGQVQVFSTDTVLSAGEYTVLGATGAEPILLVVRLEKL